MEVSGRGCSTRCDSPWSSDDCSNVILCDQCQEGDQVVDAAGFCVNCSDFLCGNCIVQHKRLRVSKDHKLLNGSDMPREKPSEKAMYLCSDHPEKSLELFCQSHDTLACLLCTTESHRMCPDVTSISKLSKGLRSSKEFMDIKASAELQSATLDSCKMLVEEYHLLNDHCYDKSVQVFEAFQKEIKVCLEFLGKRVYAEAGDLKARNRKKLDSLSETMKPMEQELKAHMADIDLKAVAGQMDQLFIVTKKNKKYIEESGKKIAHLEDCIQIQRYTFEVDCNVKQSIENMGGIRTLEMFSGAAKCTAEFDTRSADDTKDSFVTGLVEISASQIVLTDADNKCLKLIDVEKKDIVSRQPLSSIPRDIASIPGARVAVTMPGLQQIQFFSTENGLAPCGKIRVDGQCLSIDFADEDKLVVSFWDTGKIQMLDLEGKVLKRFNTSSKTSSPQISRPRYVSISSDNDAVYVSDYEKNTVTCLDMEGSVRWRFKDDDMKYPLGVATGEDGCLYVCSRDSNMILVLSPGGVKLRVVPLIQVPLRHPYAICCSRDQGSLFVSCRSDDPQFSVRKLSLQ